MCFSQDKRAKLLMVGRFDSVAMDRCPRSLVGGAAQGGHRSLRSAKALNPGKRKDFFCHSSIISHKLTIK